MSSAKEAAGSENLEAGEIPVQDDQFAEDDTAAMEVDTTEAELVVPSQEEDQSTSHDGQTSVVEIKQERMDSELEVEAVSKGKKTSADESLGPITLSANQTTGTVSDFDDDHDLQDDDDRKDSIQTIDQSILDKFSASELFDNSDSGTRHEKSLGLLTTKFVNLLQEAPDGVLDLKSVSIVCYDK